MKKMLLMSLAAVLAVSGVWAEGEAYEKSFYVHDLGRVLVEATEACAVSVDTKEGRIAVLEKAIELVKQAGRQGSNLQYDIANVIMRLAKIAAFGRYEGAVLSQKFGSEDFATVMEPVGTAAGEISELLEKELFHLDSDSLEELGQLMEHVYERFCKGFEDVLKS